MRVQVDQLPPQSTSIRADSVSIGSLLQLFSGIHVPVYQRDYAWSSEEVIELWNDTQSVMSEAEDTYFIGSMVFVGAQQAEVEVVDGQQRLIWSILLSCALRDGCYEVGEDQRAILIDNKLIVKTDFISLESQTLLKLNEHNNPLFQQIAKRELTLTEIKAKSRDRLLPISNRLLAETYVILHEFSANFTNQFRDTSKIGKIQDAVANKLLLIKIESPSDVSAYVLFETLNDRGVDLTLADLLKNYLFSHAGQRIEDVRSRWMQVGTLVGKSILTRFIRHEWMSRKGKIRERELYGFLKTSIRTTPDVINYTSGLVAAAEVYSALENSDDPIWNPYGETIKRRLKQIKLLGITQCYPLLLAGKECLGLADFERVCSWIVCLTVRYTIIGEKGTGNLETLYAKASTLVRSTPLRMSDVRSAFEDLWPDDVEFRTTFTTKSMSNAQLIKYILQSIEQSASNQPELVADLSSLTVEHVLPKNPGVGWGGPIARDPGHKDNFKRIGNLVLLTAEVNEGIGNEPYATKKPVLAGSQLTTTQFAGQFDDWTEVEIAGRQEWLADYAVGVWNLEPNR